MEEDPDRAGRTLEAHARAVLDQAVALERAMAESVSGEAGLLRLGFIEPTASQRLPGVLERVCREYPRAGLIVEIGGTDAVARRVAARELDVGICSPPPVDLELRFEPLFVERLAVLLPEGHPPAPSRARWTNPTWD